MSEFDWLEWRELADGRVLGFLKGHPETTLFIIKPSADPGRGTLLGAFVPDEEESAPYLCEALVTFLKGAAYWYFLNFLDSISAHLPDKE